MILTCILSYRVYVFLYFDSEDRPIATTQEPKAKVGEFAYSYPVVQVQSYHLWPKEEPRIYSHYYHDPFYDPWPWYGPWRRYPYWW